MFTFWQYYRDAWPRDAGWRLDHLLLNDVLAPPLSHRRRRSRRCAAGRTRAITLRPGSSCAMHLDLARNIEFVALGATFGFLGGLFGIGGATLAIPILGIVFGMTQQLAQGTPSSWRSRTSSWVLFAYWQKARLDVRAALLLAGAALPVTYVSALVATSLASRPLRIAFAIFLILIALDIARRALRKEAPASKVALPWPFLGFVGAFAVCFPDSFESAVRSSPCLR